MKHLAALYMFINIICH